jgi:hypothetical protein
MSMKRPPKNLGKALDQGYMPMFMTGQELKDNFHMYPGDREGQPVEQAWDRKLKEAKQTGEKSERYGTGYSYNKITRQGKELGVTPRSTLKKVMEKQGGTHGIIPVQPRPLAGDMDFPGKSYMLGGHHRVALSIEQFKDALHPVEYYGSMIQAQYNPNYK